MASPLPGYPERYQAADEFVLAQPLPGAKPLGTDIQLLLYALRQQVVEGPCTGSKQSGGWGWNVVENTKYQAWKQLGTMNPMEAMRLYVRTVEEEQADWWQLLCIAKASGLLGAAPKAEDVPLAPASQSASSLAVDTRWISLPLGSAAPGRRPCARYEHGAALIGPNMYVVGGTYAGRYLSDVWRLDTQTLMWEQIPTRADSVVDSNTTADGAALETAVQGGGVPGGLGAMAGHTVSVCQGKLLVLGGHTKAKSAAEGGPMPVLLVDPATGTVTLLSPTGQQPITRGGHTATLIDGKLWVFGGEDATRRPLDELHCLDLGDMAWSTPTTEVQQAAPVGKSKPRLINPPAGRSAHSAVAVEARYLVIFGGGSAATCFSDLWVLDTKAETGPRWYSVPAQGHKVSPRAGHTAAVVGDIMYVIGGGNNVRGAQDMLALGLGPLTAGGLSSPLTWRCLASTPARDPLSSEGISLVVLPVTPGVLEAGKSNGHAPGPAGGVLLAYGGYSGKYQAGASVLRVPDSQPEPTAAADNAAVPESRLAAETTPQAPATSNGSATRPRTSVSQVDSLKAEAAFLRAELANSQTQVEAALQAAAATSAADAQELALLRKQLATSQASLETAAKGLEDTRAAVAREGSKVLRLESDIAELQRRLSQAAEQTKELEHLRREMAHIKEAEVKKGGAGIWGYIAGSS